MQHDIAIAIVACNRPDALERLLHSLGKADYSGYDNIHCYISIDHSGDDATFEIAKKFKWQHGQLHIHQHEQNVGLKKNVMYCASKSEQHQAVIVLEDDLIVSPVFFQYAQQAYVHFREDEKIAGVALYANTFNEVAYCTFDPIEDGFDNYFIQAPCSWGQMWTTAQWKRFAAFSVDRSAQDREIVLPETVAAWPDESSWKKLFCRYMMLHDLYFVYPRCSLTTNFAEAGKHMTNEVSVFHASLLIRSRNFHFSNLSDSFAIYDAYFEFSGIGFKRYTGNAMDVSFDINGSKQKTAIQSEYVITARASENPLELFAASCYPYENNILLGLQKQSHQQAYLTLSLTKEITEKKNFNRKEADLCRCLISKEHAQSIIGAPSLSFWNSLKNGLKKIFGHRAK